MTAIRVVDSARYGLRLYGFVLGITILGGAAVALGAAVAWPQVDAALDGGQASLASLVAAGVLAFLGLSVLAVGYLGAAYKLVADGVAAGGAADPPEPEPVTAGATDAAQEPETAAEPASADPNVGAPGDTQPSTGTGPEPPTGVDDSPGTTTVGSMGDAGDDDRPPADPPEPSPEEIAFGGSGEDAPTSEPADEPAPSASSDSLAGQNATSDPLADPTEDE